MTAVRLSCQFLKASRVRNVLERREIFSSRGRKRIVLTGSDSMGLVRGDSTNIATYLGTSYRMGTQIPCHQ